MAPIKYLSLLFLCLFGFNALAQQYATGSLPNDEDYAATPILSPALRFSQKDLPLNSLKKYCPTPGSQQAMSSCVGWATGYAGFTIAYAVANNITNTAEINKHAKSPLFLYNQICKCDQGSYVGKALRIATKFGDCDIKDFHPDLCITSPSGDVIEKASNFKIVESHKLFLPGAPDESIISTIVNSIDAQKPVIIALNLKKTFVDVGANGLYNPNDQDENYGSHALCLIGYNNISKRFEIINSWGTNWGNKGYFTISYKDFIKYCKYAFQFTPGQSKPAQAEVVANIPASTTKPVEIPPLQLTGKFNFKKLSVNDATQETTFKDVAPVLNGNYYTFTNGSVKKDDYYRIVASGMQKDNYVYIFSLKPDKKYEVIFPLSLSENAEKINDTPIVPADNVSIQIPADDNQGLSTDVLGQDNLCILYSNKKIDGLPELVATMNVSDGDIMSRLQKVLGDRLIPAQNIKYSPNLMYFTAKSSTGDIAPIILSVNVAQ